MRRTVGDMPEDRHPVVLKSEDRHQQRGGDERHQRGRQPGADALGDKHHCKHSEPDRDGPGAGPVQLVGHVLQPPERRATAAGDTEQVGDLMHDDHDPDASQEPGDDRRREQLRDPAEAQQPDAGDSCADHHREDPD